MKSPLDPTCPREHVTGELEIMQSRLSGKRHSSGRKTNDLGSELCMFGLVLGVDFRSHLFFVAAKCEVIALKHLASGQAEKL